MLGPQCAGDATCGCAGMQGMSDRALRNVREKEPKRSLIARRCGSAVPLNFSLPLPPLVLSNRRWIEEEGLSQRKKIAGDVISFTSGLEKAALTSVQLNQGVTAMSGLRGHGKAVTLMLAAVLVLFALAYPRTVRNPLLGSDWRCSRTALVTNCTYERARAPTSASPLPAITDSVGGPARLRGI